MIFGEITGSLQDNVRKSLKFLKDSEFIRSELKPNIIGFVYDLQTGELERVQE